MKKILSSIIISVILLGQATAQKISEHSVKYMVSFDASKNLYTAWLVPNYSTPNHNNPDTEEKGATWNLCGRAFHGHSGGCPAHQPTNAGRR